MLLAGGDLVPFLAILLDLATLEQILGFDRWHLGSIAFPFDLVVNLASDVSLTGSRFCSLGFLLLFYFLSDLGNSLVICLCSILNLKLFVLLFWLEELSTADFHVDIRHVKLAL